MSDETAFKFALRRGGQAAGVVISHLVAAGTMIVSIWTLERLTQFLWKSEDLHLFGTIPLSYVFQTMDIGVLMTFSFYGVTEAYRTLKRDRKAEGVRRIKTSSYRQLGQD